MILSHASARTTSVARGGAARIAAAAQRDRERDGRDHDHDDGDDDPQPAAAHADHLPRIPNN
jgi:hypothetical protein